MKLEQFLEKVPAARPVRAEELLALGASRGDIRRFHRAGVLERLGSGAYMLAGADFDQNIDLIVVQQAVPRGLICLLSALRFHGLTEHRAQSVWVMLRPKAWRPKIEWPPVVYHYASGDAFEQGWEEHDLSGVPVRITTPAKTVADCFKYRNKIGMDVAIEALQDFYRMGMGGPGDIDQMTRMLRVDSVAGPYVEAIWHKGSEYK